MNPDTIVGAVVEELKARRIEKGLTQRDLAKRTNLSQGGIAHMELGDTTPTLLYLLAVAQILDVDLPEILARAIKTTKEKTDST